MRIPRKPFQEYKWRWAEYTPSENLNNPLRIMGILRALYRHQGESYSESDVYAEFQTIEDDTNKSSGTNVKLVRTGSRNLFRNSGRYWKALGLTDGTRKISLTSTGERLATGAVTEAEFALATITQFTLPNANLENTSTLETWHKAGLSIKPLRLIIQILLELNQKFGAEQMYLTADELRHLIIPLAGDKGIMSEYIEAIVLYRNGKLDSNTFPNCAPGDNDHRMVREFLLFFSNYGFCRIEFSKNNGTSRFYLEPDRIYELQELIRYQSDSVTTDTIIQQIRKNPVILMAERKRIQTYRMARPGQRLFREQVVAKNNSTCLLTGERISSVLEAAHIIPVDKNGTDAVENGLCLREDVHTLFDGRHIRINGKGEVHYSEMLKASMSYASLPVQIRLPDYVSEEAINWRLQYY